MKESRLAITTALLAVMCMCGLGAAIRFHWPTTAEFVYRVNTGGMSEVVKKTMAFDALQWLQVAVVAVTFLFFSVYAGFVLGLWMRDKIHKQTTSRDSIDNAVHLVQVRAFAFGILLGLFGSASIPRIDGGVPSIKDPPAAAVKAPPPPSED